MRTQTSQNIIKYIQSHTQATAKELADVFAISRQALYKHLGRLLADGRLAKIGRPPKVFYSIRQAATESGRAELKPGDREIIERNYLIITPRGEKLNGLAGFAYWCRKNNFDIVKTAAQYAETLKKFDRYKKGGLVDGTRKMRNAFGRVFLDKVFYLDFYSIERFGKTRLGQMLLYAKQSQNKNLINELVADIKPKIKQVLKQYHIDAVGFIPPTVKREVQLMKELQKKLSLSQATLNLVKIKTAVAVPQKSLARLEDRVENARETIVLQESRKFRNIVLIDDALGSGATMNETAKKIRGQKICSGRLIGLAITGSFKGFDVISEV